MIKSKLQILSLLAALTVSSSAFGIITCDAALDGRTVNGAKADVLALGNIDMIKADLNKYAPQLKQISKAVKEYDRAYDFALSELPVPLGSLKALNVHILESHNALDKVNLKKDIALTADRRLHEASRVEHYKSSIATAISQVIRTYAEGTLSQAQMSVFIKDFTKLASNKSTFDSLSVFKAAISAGLIKQPFIDIYTSKILPFHEIVESDLRGTLLELQQKARKLAKAASEETPSNRLLIIEYTHLISVKLANLAIIFEYSILPRFERAYPQVSFDN